MGLPRILKPGDTGYNVKRSPSTVYLIGCEAFVKIGVTSCVAYRLRALQAANPFDLSILAEIEGSYDIELQLHRIYAEYRHRDEWFRRDGRLATWINLGCPVKHVWAE